MKKVVLSLLALGAVVALSGCMCCGKKDKAPKKAHHKKEHKVKGAAHKSAPAK